MRKSYDNPLIAGAGLKIVVTGEKEHYIKSVILWRGIQGTSRIIFGAFVGPIPKILIIFAFFKNKQPLLIAKYNFFKIEKYDHACVFPLNYSQTSIC